MKIHPSSNVNIIISGSIYRNAEWTEKEICSFFQRLKETTFTTNDTASVHDHIF